MALHARWKYEDTEEQVLEGDALKARQQTRCRELGLIVFGFTLHDTQVEAICTLFYDKRDFLLLAKTGFGKSLIFQLLPFMTTPIGVVLILMPLKLLQAEQSEIINRLPQGKAIILNGENSQKSTLAEVAKGGYTHVFTSPEIALSKKFKKCILDQYRISKRAKLTERRTKPFIFLMGPSDPIGELGRTLFVGGKRRRFDDWLRKGLEGRRGEEGSSLLNDQITGGEEGKDPTDSAGEDAYIWPVNLQNLGFAKVLLPY
ncbi:hypothetical protein MMC31_007960 [Peltigera leucophlebia]|nr:hypothetical protein [Peltigera leucophlebia]